ncbi:MULTISPECIES: flagellar hook-basal body complex protein FliE [Malaciobacter]|jgi:flagellar hook-basal body complex protein FliE|uniref:flagellar hook-basal body complex protein FliE n=1 Tax=Malaciobacter TaxID=2321114 RepID=UPI0009A65209|nr:MULTISPECIES: flagellar hook-basal body complex protein FliE [Malaciobacter]QEE33703.1 flagellar proximal rod protein FliE [Malaciobacter canalis]SKB24926.1 flagellar hook-basal body complex protein FliE [Malaciobacter marinus]
MNISSIKDSIGSLGLSQVKNEVNSPKENESFASMLKGAVGEVNQHQIDGYDAMEGIATGKVENLQEAVQKIEEAELSLKLGLEVQNKAIAAYKEISRMQA